MGCDIHIVLELLTDELGYVGLHDCPSVPKEGGGYAWFPATDRNYRLFAAIAGVRGDGPAPRGLPRDASALSLLVLADDVSLHSHSHSSIEEFTLAWAGTLSGDTALESTQLLLEGGEAHVRWAASQLFGFLGDAEDIHRLRVVFAFDN